MNEPVADAVRGILDGHLVLDREPRAPQPVPGDRRAAVGLAPAPARSPRRRARVAAGRLRELLATYRAKEDLISIGAYQRGSDPKIDEAIDMIGPLEEFLRQGADEIEQPEIAERRLATMLGL